MHRFTTAGQVGLGRSVAIVMHSSQNVWPHSLKQEAPFRTSWQIAQMKLSPGLERKMSVGWPIVMFTNLFQVSNHNQQQQSVLYFWWWWNGIIFWQTAEQTETNLNKRRNNTRHWKLSGRGIFVSSWTEGRLNNIVDHNPMSFSHHLSQLAIFEYLSMNGLWEERSPRWTAKGLNISGVRASFHFLSS